MLNAELIGDCEVQKDDISALRLTDLRGVLCLTCTEDKKACTHLLFILLLNRKHT